MREAVIISAVRTPAGRANKGAYKDTRPEDRPSSAAGPPKSDDDQHDGDDEEPYE